MLFQIWCATLVWLGWFVVVGVGCFHCALFGMRRDVNESLELTWIYWEFYFSVSVSFNGARPCMCVYQFASFFIGNNLLFTIRWPEFNGMWWMRQLHTYTCNLFHSFFHSMDMRCLSETEKRSTCAFSCSHAHTCTPPDTSTHRIECVCVCFFFLLNPTTTKTIHTIKFIDTAFLSVSP